MLSLLLHVLKAAIAMIISPKLLAASDIVNTDIIICGFVSLHGVETVLYCVNMIIYCDVCLSPPCLSEVIRVLPRKIYRTTCPKTG